MKRAALFLLLACSRSTPQDTSGFAPGDSFLVVEDYVVMRFTIDRADAREVTGSVFGSTRTYPRDAVIPVRALGTPRCPPPGRLALVETTGSMWDIGLAVGSDGERCYLQEHTTTTQRSPKIVYEVPARFELKLATERADFERRSIARGWIARRPDDWMPSVGAEVVLASSTGLHPAKVVERRAGAIRITRAGAFQSDVIDEWRAPRDLAPMPIGPAPTASTATVCMTSDATRCLERVPPTAIRLPELALAEADVISRSLAFQDLLIELGAIHTQKPRPGTLVFVQPDGTPVAEARYELAPARADGSSSAIDAWGIVERLATAKQATAFKTIDRDVVLLYEIHIVLPEAKRPQLGNASARFAADLPVK